MNVEERILKILNQDFGIHEQVDISHSLFRVGIDSIKLMMVIVNVEEEFGIEFDDDFLLGEIKTLEELCSAVKKKLS